jgi:hypothetical protein
VFGGRLCCVILGVSLLVAGCGSGSSELTTEELLEKLAGRTLSTAEVAEQLEKADLLCGFDRQVLIEIWDRLDARQLEFQDYVFGQRCPDRLSIYEEARPTTGTAPVTSSTTTTSTSSPVSDEVFDHIGPATTSTTSTTPPTKNSPSTTTSTTTRPSSSTTTPSTTRRTTTSR